MYDCNDNQSLVSKHRRIDNRIEVILHENGGDLTDARLISSYISRFGQFDCERFIFVLACRRYDIRDFDISNDLTLDIEDFEDYISYLRDLFVRATRV